MADGTSDALIVGLGNPGPSYRYTPHNAGFLVAELLQESWALGKQKPKYRGLFSQGRVRLDEHAVRVTLLLPQTYMNESGKAVGPARGALNVPLEHLIVIHDEIDLPFGEVRVRFGGGLAGHNGLKSLRQQLGSADFWRIRVGVGRPDSTDPELVARYVLSTFQQKRDEVESLLDMAAQRVEELLLTFFK